MSFTSRVILAVCVEACFGACAASAQVKITPGPEKIAIEIHGQHYSDFYIAGADLMKPILWPIRAATGTYVTRAWPMADVPEEADGPKDHIHQRGIWFAHDSVNGSDFWNSYTAKNRGKITLKKVGEIKSGKDHGSLSATFEWTDKDDKPTLTEARVITFYDQPNLRTIDFDITLTATDKVTFGDGKDGVFGMRLRPVLQEDKGTGHISNADGLETEKEAWGKPSNWCDYSGEIKGEKVGIAMLDNSANPSHPVRWHVRAYGLFAANPFGLSVFTNDKSQDGSVNLDPGKSLHFRYRVIVHPGDVKSADIAGQWTKYTSASARK
jgi:Methane oxygenase PmoA